MKIIKSNPIPNNVAFVMNNAEYEKMEKHSNKEDIKRIVRIAKIFDKIMKGNNEKIVDTKGCI